MQLTVNEFAEKVKVDYQTASGLVRYLREKGVVKEVGSRPSKTGKGKPSTEFEIPEKVELVFSE